jgi:hypothetical protein
MVDDLTRSIPLKGKSYQEIISLLGNRQYAIGGIREIGYKIDEDYGREIDPICTKTLLLHFDKDSGAKIF